MQLRLTRVVAALILVAAANVLLVPTVRAQGYANQAQPWVQGHVMGGFSGTSGDASNYLGDGWIIDAGVTFWPQGGPLGIRADISYTDFGSGNQYYYGPGLYGYNQGWGYVSALAGGVVFRPQQYGWAHFYGLAQISGSDVQLQVPQYGPCNPYGCYYNYNSYSATKFGWNVGLGVDFPTFWGTSWFVEAQWRRVQSQQSLDYWPVTVGLRF